jgi:lipid-binding SYLF domain-containing protein
MERSNTVMKKIAIAPVGLVLIAACATAPDTPIQRRSLEASAEATLETMKARDPGLSPILADATGYAVFPDIAKGGVLAGGAHGFGVVYERGKPVGIAELNQASIGAQLGAETFSEVIVFRDERELNRLEAGNFDLGAGASAVFVKAGAAREARFERGVAVFVLPRRGLMVDLSVHGQQIDFKPRS